MLPIGLAGNCVRFMQSVISLRDHWRSKSEKKLNQLIRTFCKLWPLWAVLLAVCVWPYINDWAWDYAKEEAQTRIAQFEIRRQVQAIPGPGAVEPARIPAVEMSKLTCIAANSLYVPYWQISSSYHTKLIQAFIWHGYGREIPSAQSVKERGCGQTEDGKYLFSGN